MSRVVHFEILATDPERSAAFYREAFGWASSNVTGSQRYWPLVTGADDQPGIDGALMHKHFPQPVVNTIEVASLDAALDRIEPVLGHVEAVAEQAARPEPHPQRRQRRLLHGHRRHHIRHRRTGTNLKEPSPSPLPHAGEGEGCGTLSLGCASSPALSAPR